MADPAGVEDAIALARASGEYGILERLASCIETVNRTTQLQQAQIESLSRRVLELEKADDHNGTESTESQ